MKDSRYISRSSISHSPVSRNHLSPFEPRVFFEADDGKNLPGGDNKNPQSNPQQSQEQIEAAVSARIAQLLGSNKAGGDPMEALTISIKAQHRLEKEIERLKEQVKDTPDSNAVKSLQEQLDKYSALGKPEEIEQRLSNESTLAQEKEQRERTDAFRQAATIAGYDADALLEILPEVPEVAVSGDETKVATIKAGDESKPFGEFIQAKYSKIHDSLKAQSNGQNGRVAAPKMGVKSEPVNTEAAAREAQSRLYSGANF